MLYSKLSFVSKIVVNYNLPKRLKEKCKKWSLTHTKMIEKLQTKNLFIKPKDVSDHPMKSVIHNFSSYTISKVEEIALSYGLKSPVPHRINRNGIMTEYEYFYQQISYHSTHLGHNEQEKLKSKVRRISQSRNIVLLNQDKWQGIVILDRTKHIKKCMT